MFKPLLLAIAIAVSVSPALAQEPPCSTGANHDRWALKNRKEPAIRNAAPRDIDVAEMISWRVPKGFTKSAKEPVVAREREVYSLTAFVRMFKMSSDDCDIHIQLADSTRANARMVIAEIPKTNTAARAALAAALGNRIRTTPVYFDGDKAKRVTLTGFAFLDLSHISKANPKAGHNHGTAAVATLWELHPVWDVR